MLLWPKVLKSLDSLCDARDLPYPGFLLPRCRDVVLLDALPLAAVNAVLLDAYDAALLVATLDALRLDALPVDALLLLCLVLPLLCLVLLLSLRCLVLLLCPQAVLGLSLGCP